MKAVPLNRYIVFFSIAIAGCAVDLATKSWIFNHPATSGGDTWWIWQDIFGFKTDLNTGMLFGMGQGWTAVLAGLSVAAALGILVWLFYAGAAHDRLLNVALACVMAGILGNLYDRLGLWNDGSQQAVRDWILVMIGKWPWPTFNIADSLLVCGAVLLTWHAFGTKPKGGAGKPEGGTGKAEGGGPTAEV